MPGPQIPPPTTPTADDIYNASRLRWSRLGVTSSADLEDTRVGAAAYMVAATGRYWSDFPPPTTFPGEILSASPELIPAANLALRLRMEQVVLQAQDDYTETASDDLISNMSVGPYSETRRDTSTLRGGRYQQKPMLNTHPGLQALIEMLQTQERFEFWLYRLSGTYAPAFQVEEVDWSLVGKSALLGASGWDSLAPWTMWTPTG